MKRRGGRFLKSSTFQLPRENQINIFVVLGGITDESDHRQLVKDIMADPSDDDSVLVNGHTWEEDQDDRENVNWYFMYS
ncbi:hypothetical protein GQ600_9822 [Phytophthora cactorum]|nr:hypothetical protein GQ600_9822 [Phytophthora cactorum]